MLCLRYASLFIAFLATILCPWRFEAFAAAQTLNLPSASQIAVFLLEQVRRCCLSSPSFPPNAATLPTRFG